MSMWCHKLSSTRIVSASKDTEARQIFKANVLLMMNRRLSSSIYYHKVKKIKEVTPWIMAAAEQHILLG